MSIADLIPTVQALPRMEKLRLMQFIASDLAREEGDLASLPAVATIWSPYDSFEAAATLARMLEEEKADV